MNRDRIFLMISTLVILTALTGNIVLTVSNMSSQFQLNHSDGDDDGGDDHDDDHEDDDEHDDHEDGEREDEDHDEHDDDD